MDPAVAFRLNTHNLVRRLFPGQLAEAAGVCGMQNAAPDAALLSMHARVEGVQPGDVEQAWTARELVMTHSLRSAAYLFPRQDFPVFTHGVLPQDEEETRFFIYGAVSGLKKADLEALALVDLAGEALAAVLEGRSLGRDELGREMGRWMGARLARSRQQAWNGPSEYSPKQFLGESLARFALYVLALRGAYCLTPGPGGETLYACAETWLGEDPRGPETGEAAAELARRFLRAYGPATVEGLAGWAGIHPKQARRAWAAAQAEFVPVEREGKTAWLLHADLEAYQRARMPEGTRLLPPHDPYLALPDRATITAERGWQMRIWRTVGNPGVVLLDGRFAGLWRARKRGKVISITIESAALPDEQRKRDVIDEAASIARLRGCSDYQIQWMLE